MNSRLLFLSICLFYFISLGVNALTGEQAINAGFLDSSRCTSNSPVAECDVTISNQIIGTVPVTVGANSVVSFSFTGTPTRPEDDADIFISIGGLTDLIGIEKRDSSSPDDIDLESTTVATATTADFSSTVNSDPTEFVWDGDNQDYTFQITFTFASGSLDSITVSQSVPIVETFTFPTMPFTLLATDVTRAVLSLDGSNEEITFNEMEVLVDGVSALTGAASGDPHLVSPAYGQFEINQAIATLHSQRSIGGSDGYYLSLLSDSMVNINARIQENAAIETKKHRSDAYYITGLSIRGSSQTTSNNYLQILSGNNSINENNEFSLLFKSNDDITLQTIDCSKMEPFMSTNITINEICESCTIDLFCGFDYGKQKFIESPRFQSSRYEHLVSNIAGYITLYTDNYSSDLFFVSEGVTSDVNEVFHSVPNRYINMEYSINEEGTELPGGIIGYNKDSSTARLERSINNQSIDEIVSFFTIDQF